MTHPTDAAIAQAFREALALTHPASEMGERYGQIMRRAREKDAMAKTTPVRELDAEKGGEVVEAECWRMSKGWLSDATRQRVEANARAAIAAMQAGE